LRLADPTKELVMDLARHKFLEMTLRKNG